MISVVMPAYNAAAFLRPAIESILNQTYQQWELIVVDDGSTDATADIVREYAARDSRIKLIQTQRLGVAGAANLALEAAQYSWVARLDADDIAMPNRLERQLAAAQADPDVVLWGSYAYQINHDNQRIGFVEHGPTTREAFQKTRDEGRPVFILNPTTMFKRDLVRQLGGFDAQLQAAADEELWSRLGAHGALLVIPEHLIQYRIHNASITATRLRYQMHIHKFIAERFKVWAQGGDLTFGEFLAARQRRPFYVRWAEYLNETGRIYWRRAGGKFAAKQYLPAVGLLLLSAILSPMFVIKRVANRLKNLLR